jgi:hypothetical protein
MKQIELFKHNLCKTDWSDLQSNFEKQSGRRNCVKAKKFWVTSALAV